MTGNSERADDFDSGNSDPSKVTDEAATPAAPPPVDAATSPETLTQPGAVSIDDMMAGEVITPQAPILNKDGTVRKKPGRKPGQKNGMPPPTPSPGTLTNAPISTGGAAKSPAERKAQRAASEELARAVLSTAVGTMVALVGPEWDFQSQQEADGMKAATAAYIEAKGDGQLSPESMLLLVVAGYALPRAAHENTRTKFGRFFGAVGDWLKSAFGAIFSR